jgi:hypothetical protein
MQAYFVVQVALARGISIEEATEFVEQRPFVSLGSDATV